MIFVTVGAQMPFDRLVKAVDEWAREQARRDVFAQVGAGAEPPGYIDWTDRLDPAVFRQRVQESELIVSHAGMGSILTALDLQKPILVMPRLGRLGETRNDHQVATARALEESGRVLVAHDPEQLKERLSSFQGVGAGAAGSPEGEARSRLLGFVKGWVDELAARRGRRR